MRTFRSSQGSYLPTLDGWRAVSILSVMICHSCDFVQTDWIYRLTRHGALGVDIFFAISGLLITTRLLEFKKKTAENGLYRFYVRRFFRIIPPYFFLLLILFFLGLFHLAPIDPREITSSALFIRNYSAFPNPFGWYTGHLWSIAVEEHFYLLFPGLLFLLGPSKKKTIGVLLALCLAIAGWRNYSYHHFGSDPWFQGLSFATRSDVRLDSLFWGAIYALLLQNTEYKKTLSGWVQGYRWWLILGAWLAIALFSPPATSFLIPLLSPLLLMGTLLYPERKISGLFESQVFLYVGRISYSLYLWNSVFMPAHDARPLQMGFSILQSFPLQWLCTFAIATFSYYWIEIPFIKMGYRHS